MRSRFVVAACAGVIAIAIGLGTPFAMTTHLLGQAQPAPAFEVASVKQNKSGDPRMTFGIDGARFTAFNIPLDELIRVAYGIDPRRLSGGPAWIHTDRFDITAKADTQLEPGQAPPQLVPLLAERFRLKVRWESREQPVYVLVVNRPDGKLGPNLHLSSADYCAEANARLRSGQPKDPKPDRCFMRMGPGSMSGGSMGLNQLAKSLVPVVNRTVLDRTGLAGLFDFDVTFTPEFALPGPPSPGGAPTLVNGIPTDSNGPSIFTALQEQLGLKLDSQEGPVDVLVVDSVEHPTDD
jgi:uncharacterized protein (TIGR03435 family)